MHANTTNGEQKEKIIYRELCYRLNGLLFKIHNELGRYCREKQYADALEKSLRESSLRFVREKALPLEQIDNQGTNRVDFDIEGKMLLDLKAKPTIVKEDYYQMQRYLRAVGYKLGLIINFRNQHLKPLRVICHS